MKVFESDESFAATEDHIKALLTHELVHLYLQQRRGASGLKPALPMWFEEGLAELVSGGSAMGMVTESEATRAILAGNHLFPDAESMILPPERCKYGVEPHMFYRQAEMFVAYLQSLDETRFRSLVLAVAGGHDFESSWRARFGIPLHDAWRQFLRALEAR